MGYETVPEAIIKKALEVLFTMAKKDARSCYDEPFWEDVAIDAIDQAVKTFNPERNQLGVNGFVGWAIGYYRGKHKSIWRKLKRDREINIFLDQDVAPKNPNKAGKTNGHNFVSERMIIEIQSLVLKDPEAYLLKKEEAAELHRILEVMYKAIEEISDEHRDLICKEYGLMGEACRRPGDLEKLYGYTSYHRTQAKQKLGNKIVELMCRIYPKSEQEILADYYGWEGKNKKNIERISEIHGLRIDQIESIVKRAEEQVQYVTEFFI